jgi:hypothetical protein
MIARAAPRDAAFFSADIDLGANGGNAAMTIERLLQPKCDILTTADANRL